MAKKKIDLNAAPLETVVVGNVNQSKYGWIWTILLFGLFIAIIFYLPEIENLFEKYFKTSSSPSTEVISNPTTNEIVNDEEKQIEDKKYEINYDLVVELDSIKYTYFKYENNILSFTSINTSDKAVQSNNTFMELYDENDNLIKRIMLNKSVEALASQNYEYALNSTISYFYIKNIEEDDYTYIDVEISSNGQSTLTCQNENETLTYTFINDKLKNIEDIIKYANTNQDYQAVYDKYKTEVITYSNTNGISSNIGLDSNGLIYTMKIDYTLLEISLNNRYYFSINASIRKVNFEMESMLFDCK